MSLLVIPQDNSASVVGTGVKCTWHHFGVGLAVEDPGDKDMAGEHWVWA